MKNFISILITRSVAIVLIAGILLPACTKEDDVVQDPGTAPTVPPSSTFAMDFSAFSAAGDYSNGRMTETKYHFGYAAANFLFWQSFLTMHLTVPVAAFKAAVDQKASYIPDEQRWLWSYEVEQGTHTYQAKLYAAVNDGTIDWEMYVSKSDSFQDFLWYKGISARDGRSGSWTVSVEPEGNAREALLIEWERKDDEVASIKYTSIDQSSDAKDSYIAYGKTDEGDFDSFYHVYLSSTDKMMKIDINSETKAGRVQSPHDFQDDTWHCWNTEMLDISCAN